MTWKVQNTLINLINFFPFPLFLTNHHLSSLSLLFHLRKITFRLPPQLPKPPLGKISPILSLFFSILAIFLSFLNILHALPRPRLKPAKSTTTTPVNTVILRRWRWRPLRPTTCNRALELPPPSTQSVYVFDDRRWRPLSLRSALELPNPLHSVFGYGGEVWWWWRKF